MFSLFALLASLSVLYFVLRYRVHVNITYQATNRQASVRRPVPVDNILRKRAGYSSVPVVASGNGIYRDLQSALVGLGCSKPAAKIAADKAVSAGPADFDVLLRRAIQEAA